MKGWPALFLLAVAVALALRLPELDRRPMHNDEAVNALKFRELWERGTYHYDPAEFHGPTLHYFTAAVLKLTGAPDFKQLSETQLRFVTVIAGVLLILLLPLAHDSLGRGAIAVAAVFTALSPVMVFYSRYWIHEQLLVLFTFVALASGWSLWKKPTWPKAALTGLAFGLMHATKETFVFVLAAAAGAMLVNWLWLARISRDTTAAALPPIPRGKIALALAVWFIVWAALFSSFGSNLSGLMDSFTTYKAWMGHAGEHSVHAHEWSFYFERLFWFKHGRGPVSSEALLLILAIVGALDSFRRVPRHTGDAGFVRFLAIFTLLLAGIYTVIPYKTPWCALGFAHGMILLAGVGVVVIWQRCRTVISKSAVAFVLVLGATHLGWQAWRGSFEMPASRPNPWVYGQTSPDLLNLVEAVQGATKSRDGDATVIKIITTGGDCWPLPWYLRQFENTGWFENAGADITAPIVIASPEMKLQLEARGTHIAAGYYQLRPMVFLELHVERSLWEKSVED